MSKLGLNFILFFEKSNKNIRFRTTLIFCNNVPVVYALFTYSNSNKEIPQTICSIGYYSPPPSGAGCQSAVY